MFGLGGRRTGKVTTVTFEGRMFDLQLDPSCENKLHVKHFL